MTHFQGSFFIPRGRGCSWTSGALCIRHTRAAIFEYFSPLIDDSTRQNFIPILRTHAEMNLCSRHTCPQKAYDWTLFLFGAIYKFRCLLHHSVTTLILYCKVSRLVRLTSHMTPPEWLVTWHSQTRQITTPPALTVSRENIKVRKLVEDPSYKVSVTKQQSAASFGIFEFKLPYICNSINQRLSETCSCVSKYPAGISYRWKHWCITPCTKHQQLY